MARYRTSVRLPQSRWWPFFGGRVWVTDPGAYEYDSVPMSTITRHKFEDKTWSLVVGTCWRWSRAGADAAAAKRANRYARESTGRAESKVKRKSDLNDEFARGAEIQ